MKNYTWRDWMRSNDGMSLFWIEMPYRELGWRYFGWRPWRMFRVRGFIPQMWYYLRCRVWTRYHVVAPKTLPPTWQDADKRMLHAMFEILRSVIEDERIHESNAADGDPNDGESWAWALAEMTALWQWWTVTRPARDAEYDRLLHRWSELRRRDVEADKLARPERWKEKPMEVVGGVEAWPSSFPSDDEWESAELKQAWADLRALDDDVRDAEDDVMLHRLVAVRRYMWT